VYEPDAQDIEKLMSLQNKAQTEKSFFNFPDNPNLFEDLDIFQEESAKRLKQINNEVKPNKKVAFNLNEQTTNEKGPQNMFPKSRLNSISSFKAQDEQLNNVSYIKNLLDMSSFTKNINDKKTSMPSPFSSTNNITDINNDSDSVVNSNFINNLHEMDLTRKISDDVTTRSSRRNYKINNINFMKKEMIFKSEKIRKNTSKSNDCTNQYSESDLIEEMTESKMYGKKKGNRLLRNRMSAKKSRAKKKMYIKQLETILHKTCEEVEYLRLMNSKSNKIEKSLDNMLKKENEYMNLMSEPNTNYLLELKQNALKQEHAKIQNQAIIELFQKMVRSFIPLEFKYFEKKFLKLNDITSFESLDTFLEKIIHNQIIMEEANSFQNLGPQTPVSLPIRLFIFFEQLKQLAIRLREFLLEVKKLNM